MITDRGITDSIAGQSSWSSTELAEVVSGLLGGLGPGRYRGIGLLGKVPLSGYPGLCSISS